MLRIDLHTHSIASGHALNTVYEMAYWAAQKGITHLGITDHGPSMTGAPHAEYFWISDQIVSLYGVKLLLGVEANIIDDEGQLDLPDAILKKQQIVSAGLHELTPFRNGGIAYNTRSIVNAMKNPLVKIITHPFRPEFPVDVEQIVYESVKTQTVLEVNNRLFLREEMIPELLLSYKRMVALCKELEVKVIVGSDAHVAMQIGNDNGIEAVREELGLTFDMVLNNYPAEVTEMLLRSKSS